MIHLPRRVLARVEAASVAAYPDECCGFLVGRDDGARIDVSRHVASPNLAADRRHAFEIDPQLWLDLRRDLADGPERLVGLYHSHPDGPAAPSPRDRQDAWHEGFAWLIIALSDGAVVEAKAWRYVSPENGFRPIELHLDPA